MLFPELLLVAATFQQGNEYYREGDFRKAEAVYDSLVESGIKNPYLFYNLGNTYFRLNQRGKALFYYMKAYYYIPHDTELLHNIHLITGETPVKNPLVRFIKRTVCSLNMGKWLLVFLLLYGPGMCFLTLFILKRYLSLLWISIPLIVLSFIPLGSSLWWLKKIKSKDAVCIVETEAMSGPGEQYQKLMVVDEGTLCRILRRDRGWVLISLGGGAGGWVEEKNVWQLSP